MRNFVIVALCACAVGGFTFPATAQPPPETVAVKGKVTDDRGNPIAGAQVTLHRLSRPHQTGTLWSVQTLTSDEGEFMFPEVETAWYALRVTAENFAEFACDIFAGAGVKIVSLRPIELSPAPSVSGRILDARGAAVADTTLDAIVEWESITNKRREISITEQKIRTDSEGRYSLMFRGFGSGAFVVRVAGRGWAVSPPLRIEDSSAIQGVDLRLRYGVEIQVLVVSRDTGKPVAQADVFAQYQPTSMRELPLRLAVSSRTGQDGRCQFTDIPPGCWSVTARFADETFRSERTRTVRVSPEKAARVALDLSSGAAVSVRVLEADAKTPVPHAQVRLDYNETQVTNEEGGCTFEHVAAGAHRLSVRAQGFALSTQSFQLTDDRRALTVNVILRTANGSIAGWVRDANGKPLPYAFVAAVSVPKGAAFAPPMWAWTDDGWRDVLVQQLDRYGDDAVVEADAAGQFVITGLAPGRYILFSPMVCPPDAVSPVVVVEAGKTTEDVDVTVDASCRYHISGRVLRADGAPLGNALVQMTLHYTGDGSRLVTHRFLLSTDAEGRYYFVRRGGGTYFIEATVPGMGVAKIWCDLRGDELMNRLDLVLRR